jgi:hypothetical protein
MSDQRKKEELVELTATELNDVSGGHPALVAAGVFLARRYGAQVLAAGAGAAAGWLSE